MKTSIKPTKQIEAIYHNSNTAFSLKTLIFLNYPFYKTNTFTIPEIGKKDEGKQNPLY